MNKKFKKMISSVLAAVMTVGVVGVANVSSVFAAATDGVTMPSKTITNSVEIGKTYKFKTGDKDVYSSGVSDGADNLSNDGRFATTCQVNSNGFNLKSNRVAQFKTPADEACKVSVSETNGKKGYICYTDANGDAKEEQFAASTVTSSGEIPANTIVTLIGTTAGTSKVDYITVKTAKTSTSFYTLSGTVKVDGVATSGITLTLTGSETATSSTATTDSTGAYKFENIGNLDTVSVSVSRSTTYFGAKSDDLALTENTTLDFDLDAVVEADAVDGPMVVDLLDGLTAKADNEELEYDRVLGGYATAVQSGSTATKKRLSDSGVYAVEIAKAGQSSVKFTTTAKLRVIVPFSSNGSSNESKLVIKDANGEAVGDAVTCTGTEFTTSFEAVLEAGTYEIASTSSDRGTRLKTIIFEDPDVEIAKADVNGVAYVKADDKEYAVAIIGADKVENSSFNLTDGTNVKSGELTEVYTSVKLGDAEYSSENLTNGSVVGAYLYGFNLTGDNAKSIIAGAAVAYNE